MKVYGQIWFESGSYANPHADDYEQWESMADAKAELREMWFENDVNPAGGQGVTLLLWRGEPDTSLPFPCDGEPDYVFKLGVRGGAIRVQ